MALVYSHNTSHTFDVRLKQPYDESLKKLNEYMEQVHSTKALEFIPIDTMLKEIYRNVYRFRNSVWITSTFILLIVVMGLIGYVNDETQRRSKEIAIRKVNGAEASTILRLLSRDILCCCPIGLDGNCSIVLYRKGLVGSICRNDRYECVVFCRNSIGDYRSDSGVCRC